MRILLSMLVFIGLSMQIQAQKKGFKALSAEHSFATTKGDSLTLAQIIEKNKGKVIYIDFWASWCMPCLQEMPYSRSLKKELQQDTNIVFVYLSIDDTNEVWLKTMERLKMQDMGQHYRRSRQDIESLMRHLYIVSIPHYWIIDKNGVPRELDAAPPSDRRIAKVLAKMAKE